MLSTSIKFKFARKQQLGNPSDYLSTATSNDPVSIAISCVLLTLLFIIILTASPPLRDKFHDTFEISHRYLGWSCLAILVLYQIRFQFIIALDQAYPLENLLINPVLLMIALMIFSVFLPWISVQCFDDFKMHCPSKGVLAITIPGKALALILVAICLPWTPVSKFLIPEFMVDQM